MDPESIVIRIAGEPDEKYAEQISDETRRSAIQRGSGISNRSPENIVQKMRDGKAVVAVTSDAEWVGFSYIEIWSNGEFVSNSGLIVSPAYRLSGAGERIKQKIFQLSSDKYPNAKIFSITTSLAIMKMNARLGFDTITFNEITQDSEFWEGCKSCVNYEILQRKERKNCLCTSMLFSNPIKKQLLEIQ